MRLIVVALVVIIFSTSVLCDVTDWVRPKDAMSQVATKGAGTPFICFADTPYDRSNCVLKWEYNHGLGQLTGVTDSNENSYVDANWIGSGHQLSTEYLLMRGFNFTQLMTLTKTTSSVHGFECSALIGAVQDRGSSRGSVALKFASIVIPRQSPFGSTLYGFPKALSSWASIDHKTRVQIGEEFDDWGVRGMDVELLRQDRFGVALAGVYEPDAGTPHTALAIYDFKCRVHYARL